MLKSFPITQLLAKITPEGAHPKVWPTLIKFLARGLAPFALYLVSTAPVWGQSCFQAVSFEMTPPLPNVAFQTQTGSFTVQDANNCGWALQHIPSWVHLNNAQNLSGRGRTVVGFAIDPPSQYGARADYIQAGNYYVVIYQQAPSSSCTQRAVNNDGSFSPSFVEKIGASGGRYSFYVGPDNTHCSWGITQSPPWVSIPLQLGSGTYDTEARVDMTVGAFSGTRVGVIIAANQALLVYQGPIPTPCQYTVSGPTDTPSPIDNGQLTESFNVTTSSGCSWTATKPTDAYGPAVNVTRTGTSAFSFAKNKNLSATTITSTLHFSFNFDVHLVSTPLCSNIHLSVLGNPIPVGGGQIQIIFSIPVGCYNITKPDWLSQVSLTGQSTGIGTLVLSALPNNHPASLNGTVTMAGQSVAVMQLGSTSCGAFTVSANSVSIPVDGGSKSVTVNGTQGCSFTISGGGNGFTATNAGNTVTITRNSNDSSIAQQATFTIAGNSVTATQPGASCANVHLTAPSPFTNSGGTASVGVNIPQACPWTATGTGGWFTLNHPSGNGPGSIGLTAAANPRPVSQSGTVSIGGASVTISQARTRFRGTLDFDGDGFSDPVVWRPATGTWYLLPSTGRCPTNFAANGPAGDGLPGCQRQFGLSTDLPVTADFDGDNRKDLGLWRASNSTIYMEPSTGICPANWSATHNIDGLPMCTRTIVGSSFQPVVGDFDNDGYADIAFFRTTDQEWIVLTSSYSQPADFNVFIFTGAFARQFGLPGDKPVPADYDNDGATDIAVYRAGVVYMLPSSGFCPVHWTPGSPTPDGRTICLQHGGGAADTPVSADYDGDGIPDEAVFNPANQVWTIFAVNSSLQNLAPAPEGRVAGSRQWGLPGDIPVTGDFDGDHISDLMVYRPAEGRWYLAPSRGYCPPRISQAASAPDGHAVCVVQWGLNGDIPRP